MSEIKDDGGVSGGHDSSDTSDEEEMIDAEVDQEDAEVEQEDAEIEQEDVEIEQEESVHSEEEEDQSPAENGESPAEANLSDNQEAASPEHTTDLVMDDNTNGDVDEPEKSKSDGGEEGSPANHFEAAAAAPSDGISESKIEDRSGEELNNEVNDAAEPGTPKENGVKEEEALKEEVALVEYPVNTEGSNQSFAAEQHIAEGDESGSEEEQAAFMKELENFFRDKSLEFKPPKFYGEGLNCLKLWRAVTRLGGYDQVTSCKLWRQVGESFKPPKTCTTVSWSFRCFYEKALLEYERHKMRGGELCIPVPPIPEPIGVEQVDGHKASGSGRARRDAAARAMQGWHSQRLLGNGEVGDPIIKDKNSIATPKRDKHLKSVGLLKRKKPSSLDRAVKAERTITKVAKPHVDTIVADIGPAADWVKINVRRTKDCFEVYALVPGLLREEVRVQSDPAGRLVISGDPEQPDNPWGVTPFKKVISLPSRIDPHQTSAVVTLHGQLFVRVPFEQSDL